MIKYPLMKEAKLKKIIGENLQKARKSKRYTQKEVADSVNMSESYYATLEQGVAMASVEMYYKIFATLGVKASDIFPD